MRLCKKKEREGQVIHTAACDSACSGIEHEDEVYSDRQLAGRDSADPVKSEKSLPALVPTAGPTALHDDDDDNNDKKEDAVPADVVAEQPAIVDDDTPRKSDRDRPRPLAVTASIFQRSSNGNDCCKNGSRKDNALPKPLQDEKAFVGVRALKESLEESIKEWKENDEPAAAERQEDCRPSFASTPFVFQVMTDILCISRKKWLIQQIYKKSFLPHQQIQRFYFN